MKIYLDTFKELLSRIQEPPPEVGGILGGREGIVSIYILDKGLSSLDNYDHYYPDVKKLNEIIKEWSNDGISFYGIFHSHFPGGNKLSIGDKKFIRQIMFAMPSSINRLFFPVILSKKIIGYQAVRYESQVYICHNRIEVI